MDTCSNCGAALRSGAKFCTTCGARQNPKIDPANTGWETQPTEVIETVKPQEPEPPARVAAPNNDRFQSWGDAYSSSNTSESTDDPASRFISALERNPIPTADPDAKPEEDEAPAPEPTWVTPPPTAFTPPTPSTWSWGGTTEESTSTDSARSQADSVDDSWKAPDSWSNVADMVDDKFSTPSEDAQPAPTPEPEKDLLEEVEIEEPQDDTVIADGPVEPEGPDEESLPAPMPEPEKDLLEEADVIDTAPAPDVDPADARARAISLVDELRQMIRLMPSGEPQDAGAAAMGLTEASLSVEDYSDLREAVTSVQENPRDIQALSNLAAKSDRIDALLESHANLQAAIEKAIADLTN